jgi:chromosome segregation ATPase
MGVDKREASTDSRVEWLDEELRLAKAALHKVEHELEQALNQIFNLDSTLRKVEENTGSAEGVAAALPAIHEEIRQLRDEMGRLREKQNAMAGRTEDLARQQQADLERERQERAAVVSQADTAVRSIGQFESRVQHVEETFRRVEEAAAELKSVQEVLRRDLVEIANRSARNKETALRLEHEVDSAKKVHEALEKRDLELEEKVRLAEERVQRGEERIDKFEQHMSLPLEMKEELDRGRFERQQLTERLGKLEGAASEMWERTAEFIQGLARVDHRTQAQSSQIEELAKEIQLQQETVFEQLKRLITTMERQRRRQVEALTQEIKELARSEPKTDEQ